MKLYTAETEHFQIHYHDGLGHLVERVAARLEMLHDIFSNTYHITLPSQTDVILFDGDMPDGFAYPPLNTIFIGTHNFDFSLRGTHDWFDDVVTHEFAHIVSIWTGFKFPSWMPHIQGGVFSHPNQRTRSEALHLFPTEILPPWFTEGIAQYESSLHGSDRWDSHRDMILRTVVLSGNPLSWDHMQVFTGRGDDYEKVYNHGFSLVKYISQTYGYEKVVSLLRESAKVNRLSFDRSIQAVLGISGNELYANWIRHLENKYRKQISEIGEQVYGEKISKYGFSNYRPRFSRDDSKIFFLSNGQHDYSFNTLVSYALCDTLDDDKRVQVEMGIRGNYDLHPTGNFISYKSSRSRTSARPSSQGGQQTQDLYIDTLSNRKPSLFRRSTHRQITEQKSIFASSFSPDGDMLAVAKRKFDRYYLAIVDTSGETFSKLYPQSTSDTSFFANIFNLSWSPDGRSIAVDYFDTDNRKIGIYDTLTNTFSVVLNTEHDQREPAFSSDGSALYFSSDRTGIFNIYRFIFESGKLEQLTNVSGGAFSPTVCSSNRKLAYAGYDNNGYGIFLIDSIAPLSSEIVSEGVILRSPPQIATHSVSVSRPREYSRIPRQFLLVPTLISEQIVTSEEDHTQGVSTLKMGAVVNLLDPFAWAGLGTELGAFLLFEPSKLFSTINLDKGIIDPRVNFDIGGFGTSSVLPIDITVDYLLRGVSGEDLFFDLSEGEYLSLPYSIRLQDMLLQFSHIPGSGGITRRAQGFGFHLFTGFNRYDVALDLNDAYGQGVFNYNLEKGYRAGTMVNFLSATVDSRMYISPRGLALKLQYDYWNRYSLQEENSFEIDGAVLRENYDTYQYHQINGSGFFGITTPWHPRHDLHLSASGSYLRPIAEQQTPSFHQPVAWIPGYTYFYRDTTETTTDGTTRESIRDTVLVSGNAVLSGELSYRFPLWPGMINRKFSFLHLERLYWAFNLSVGGGWENPADALDFRRSDWLLAYGAELRLEAQSFNTYPFAVKFRWDYGADRPTPVGGHRFTFSLGFNFDQWSNVFYPDYYSPGKHTRSQFPFRAGK
ncbi:hypothetical protein CHISP_2778 [Chitinispirillum alkaliphilum]|nr:hypothetical protein CHISP_2778 [Chitinispirillum alkaliphilum]